MILPFIKLNKRYVWWAFFNISLKIYHVDIETGKHSGKLLGLGYIKENILIQKMEGVCLILGYIKIPPPKYATKLPKFSLPIANNEHNAWKVILKILRYIFLFPWNKIGFDIVHWFVFQKRVLF